MTSPSYHCWLVDVEHHHELHGGRTNINPLNPPASYEFRRYGHIVQGNGNCHLVVVGDATSDTPGASSFVSYHAYEKYNEGKKLIFKDTGEPRSLWVVVTTLGSGSTAFFRWRQEPEQMDAIFDAVLAALEKPLNVYECHAEVTADPHREFSLTSIGTQLVMQALLRKTLIQKVDIEQNAADAFSPIEPKAWYKVA